MTSRRVWEIRIEQVIKPRPCTERTRQAKNRDRNERLFAGRRKRVPTPLSRYAQVVSALKDMNSWTNRTGHARLRSFVADDGHFWLEQNAQKRSKWSALARKGHQIAWEFDAPGGAYTGRMLIDGEICTPAEATKKYLKR